MGNYFSTNLKFIREQKGLSQNKLANMIGVNQTTIARWEDDNRVPTIDNAVDISEALNIPLPELLGKDLRIQQYDEKELKEEANLKKYALSNDAVLTINKKGPITAEDALKMQSELQNILLEEVQKEQK